MKLSALLLLTASLVIAQPQTSSGQNTERVSEDTRSADRSNEATPAQAIWAQRKAAAERTAAGNRRAARLSNATTAATPLVAASAVAGQTQFSTGQAARLVIGQPRFAAQRSETAQTIIGAAQGVAFANGTLVVADSNRQGGFPNNNRVLIFSNIASQIPAPHDEVVQNGTPCPICLGSIPGAKAPAGTPWPGATTVLGQPDFTSYLPNQSSILNEAPTAKTMRFPVGVAYNGTMFAVADAENNRVLVWKSLPQTNNQPADFVVGQPDFVSYTSGQYGLYGYPHGHASATSLRAPSGVFFDSSNGLWVADTGNDRVLYYGPIAGNGQSAKLVLGQSNFDKNSQSIYTINTTANSLFAPASVSSDGQHLIVADNYQNRVLIWNSIPTSNGQAADVVVGQKDFTSNYSNTLSATVDAKSVTIYHSDLCASNGTDTTTETGTTILLYPSMCAGTISAPMSAISDGTRLFIADSGNDRVLVYNHIPTTNGAAADVILGQGDEFVDNSSDSNVPQGVSSADSFKSPNSLATDGTNLYVADTFNRRVAVYTPGDFQLPIAAIRSAASPFVYAQGTVTVTGTPEADTLTITIGNSTVKDSTGTAITVGYSYAEKASDSIADIVNGLANAVNSANSGAGDPYVTAIPNPVAGAVILKAKATDLDGNNVTLATSTSVTSPTTTLTASGTSLSGGQDSSMMAPFALVRVTAGANQTLVNLDASQLPPVQPLDKPLPTSLAGVEFYVDGIKCPLISVSTTSIVAQMPIELAFAMEPETTPPDPSSTVNVTDTTRFPRTASGVLRVTDPKDGTVTVSSAVHIPIIQQNPSVFYDLGSQPNPGIAFHSSSQATATVSIDGSIQGGDQATIAIRDRVYTYTVHPSDALVAVRDALVAMINASDPEVQATPSGAFSRIRLQAYLPGPLGNGVPISTSVGSSVVLTAATSTTAATYATAKIILTAFNSELCCANIAGAPITADNPAVPGETISVFATGLGRLRDTGDFIDMINGQPFNGSETNNVTDDGFLAGLVGGKTANILFSGLKVGYVGIYQVDMELNTSLTTNPKAPLTISQLYQTSNIVTIPVVSTAPAN